MRVAVLGNSGSGKSTIARWLSARTGAAALDLDTVAWEPGQIAVPRSPDVAVSEVRAFCAGNEHWIVEGCYAGLIGVALETSARLLFLNPGEARCKANCLARPWEAHKYSSREEQDKRLAALLTWVGEYYLRDGDMSLSAHRACFAAYKGPKQELTEQPVLDPPGPEVLAWLR